MSKPFDYSKWDNIELSDDEEDVHPNIDRESWFRMKHRSRVEREEHEEKDKKRIVGEVREHLIILLFSINPIMIHSEHFLLFFFFFFSLSLSSFLDGQGNSAH